MLQSATWTAQVKLKEGNYRQKIKKTIGKGAYKREKIELR